jgi:3-oxoadipate enol-lactonase
MRCRSVVGLQEERVPELDVVKQGRGPAVVLSHALGADLHMWDEVAGQLARSFTVLRYDHPGHGRSAPLAGPCAIGDIARSAAEMIARVAPEPVHFVGTSLGGLVAQQLAADHPELVRSIVLAHTCIRYDDIARGIWRARIETALNRGMGAAAEGAVKRWFSPEFRNDARGAERVAALRAVFEATDARSYAAVCEAVSVVDFGGTNPRIGCPTLVIAGSRDESIPLATVQALCNTISGAELAVLETGHMSPVESPQAFADLVAEFIGRT